MGVGRDRSRRSIPACAGEPTLVSSARCLSERLAEVRFNQGRLIDRMGDVGFDFRRVTLGAVAGMSWAAASSKSDS